MTAKGDKLAAVDSQGLHRRIVSYEDELNPEQLQVAMHPGGPMLVLAGAGSGKTRTLVYRVCRLIEDGVPAATILLLTFTNKAAREMLQRVDRLVEHRGGRVTGGTFHSAGHRILRRYGELLGYSQRFAIIDQEDAGDLMGNALADISPKLPSRRSPKPSLLVTLYSFVINTGLAIEEIVANRAPEYLDQVAEISAIFKRYVERKRAANLMDFDDLLLNWLVLLKRFPKARRELSERFRHLLVDEYQDTNRLQADIVDAMLGRERNLMVVGDDAQSIYGFRGADFDNIISFPERHQGCEVFRLETNYRSTPQILNLANASIIHNKRQFKKELQPIRGDDDLPLRIAVPTPEDQATYVAERVLELREEGYELEEMAVLYRSHYHAFELQLELTRRKIPYRIRSGLRFFEQRHIKDLLAHLRFIDNPHDEVALNRLLKLRRGFGPRLTARVWKAIAGGDPLAALARLQPATIRLPAGAARSLGVLQGLLADLGVEPLLTRPGEAVRLVLERFYRQYAKEQLDNASSRIQDIEQLALFADGYPDVNTFLAEVTLLNDLSGEDAAGGPPDELLTLSSVHQAKGLEWKVVFVIWLSEGRFPSFRAEDEEEERRLFYVAVTRACERLFLLNPEISRDRYMTDVIVEPSRFLTELPDELTENLTCIAEQEEDGFDDMAPLGRYELPGFLPSVGEDEND